MVLLYSLHHRVHSFQSHLRIVGNIYFNQDPIFCKIYLEQNHSMYSFCHSLWRIKGMQQEAVRFSFYCIPRFWQAVVMHMYFVLHCYLTMVFLWPGLPSLISLSYLQSVNWQYFLLFLFDLSIFSILILCFSSKTCLAEFCIHVANFVHVLNYFLTLSACVFFEVMTTKFFFKHTIQPPLPA